MIHKFDIWKKYKNSDDKIGYICAHLEISESELEKLALQLYKERYTASDDEIYEARLSETIIA